MNIVYTPAAEEMKDIFKEVKKIFVTPTICADEETTDTDSESEELDIAQGGKSKSDEETKQKGQGLKILTPQQMITRLPILLAQLKAGNNSEKLKNEIRQLLYSLHRSKTLSKMIYNSLINII